MRCMLDAMRLRGQGRSPGRSARDRARAAVSRVTALLAGLLVLSLLAPLSILAAPGDEFPEVIPLPDGFQPEGIVIGRGTRFYVGSLADGAIFAGDLRTGEGEVLAPGAQGRMTVGLSFDRRSNAVFAAGGGTGKGFVFDGETGAMLAEFQLTTEASFVNDVVVTRRAAYFTDSFRPVLYRVPLSLVGALSDPGQVEEVPLGGDFEFVAGEFNTNGIDATPTGKWLVIVNSTLGRLYRVDPATGDATLIDLKGKKVLNGDGILLNGKTLYVVQNQLNKISVVELQPGLTEGKVERFIRDRDFRIPTTIAQFGNHLYAVNARFDTPPTPDTEYEVVRVAKH